MEKQLICKSFPFEGYEGIDDGEEVLPICIEPEKRVKFYKIGIKDKNFKFSIELYNTLSEDRKTALYQFLHSDPNIPPPYQIFELHQGDVWQNNICPGPHLMWQKECDKCPGRSRGIYPDRGVCEIEYFLCIAYLEDNLQLFRDLLSSITVKRFTWRLAKRFFYPNCIIGRMPEQQKDFLIGLFYKVKDELFRLKVQCGWSFFFYMAGASSRTYIIGLMHEHNFPFIGAECVDHSVSTENYPFLLDKGYFDSSILVQLQSQLKKNEIEMIPLTCRRLYDIHKQNICTLPALFSSCVGSLIRNIFTHITPGTIATYADIFKYCIEHGFLDGTEFSKVSPYIRSHNNKFVLECGYFAILQSFELQIEHMKSFGIHIHIHNPVRLGQNASFMLKTVCEVITTDKYRQLCNAHKICDSSTTKPLNTSSHLSSDIEISRLSIESNSKRAVVDDYTEDTTTPHLRMEIVCKGILYDKERNMNIYSIVFSPDGRYVATRNLDNILRVFDSKSGQLLHQLDHKKQGVYDIIDIAFSRQEKYIISCDERGNSILFWDVESGKLVRRVKSNVRIDKMVLSFDGKKMILSCYDKMVYIQDIETFNVIHKFGDCLEWGGSIAISNNDEYVARGGVNGTIRYGINDSRIRVWNTVSGKLLWTSECHQYNIISLSFSPDSTRLISGGYNLYIWDAVAGVQLQQLCGHSGMTRAVYSPNGKFIVSGGNDGTVRIWDVASGTQSLQLNGYDGQVSSVAFSPDNKHIVSGGSDGIVRLWDISSVESQSQLYEDDSVDSVKADLVLCPLSTVDTSSLQITSDSKRIILDGSNGPVNEIEYNVNQQCSALNRSNTDQYKEGKSVFSKLVDDLTEKMTTIPFGTLFRLNHALRESNFQTIVKEIISTYRNEGWAHQEEVHVYVKKDGTAGDGRADLIMYNKDVIIIIELKYYCQIQISTDRDIINCVQKPIRNKDMYTQADWSLMAQNQLDHISPDSIEKTMECKLSELLCSYNSIGNGFQVTDAQQVVDDAEKQVTYYARSVKDKGFRGKFSHIKTTNRAIYKAIICGFGLRIESHIEKL